MVFISLYTELLWRPLFNGLVFFYTILPGRDLGLAIVALTIAIRLILAPVLWKAQKAQHALAGLQPEIKKIQERHKGDKEAHGRAVMALYAQRRVNPFSGCVLLLVQIPILITLFQVFRQGLSIDSLRFLYPFITHPGAISTVGFFGVLDLAKGNIVLGAVAAATQFLQTRLTAPPPQPAEDSRAGDFTKALQWQTTYIFPLLILVWSYSLPSALTLHWTMMNLFGIVEQIIIKLYGRRDDGKRGAPSGNGDGKK